MPIERYRLMTPTTAVLPHQHGKDELVTIPAGGLVLSVQTVSDKAPFTEVFWQGKKVRMFTVDFRERTELVRSRLVKIFMRRDSSI